MKLERIFGAADLRRFGYAQTLVLFASLIPLSTLSGWALDSPLLESSGMGTRMNPLTGISLLCIAAASILLLRSHPRAARFFAIPPLAISVFRFYEFTTGGRTGFDLILFHDRITNQPRPNHIALNTACMIVGLALPVLLRGGPIWRDELAAWIVICTGTLPFFAILGYAAHLGSLYGFQLETPMAFNTASGGLLLEIAVLISLKNTRPLRAFSSPASGGIMARKLFPLALVIPVVVNLALSIAVDRALVEKNSASAAFSIGVVILVLVVIHRTATSLDQFDLARLRQSEIIQDQNHQLTGLVHELRATSDDLIQAHAELNAVMDAATQTGIIGMDETGMVRLFNTGAEAILGFKPSEVIGVSTLLAFIEQASPEDSAGPHAPLLFSSLVEPVTAGTSNELDATMLRKDRTRFSANISLTARQDQNGRVRGYLAVVRDITELRRNEETLQEARRSAEAAAQSKSDFLATMSHEIRTPMNGVIGMTGLLLDTGLSQEQREYALTIRNSGEALLAIINDILDFSKIDAGKVELEEIDFDIFVTIEECAELVAETAHAKGIELIIAARPERSGLFRGDQARLRQVLLNLISNAVKFTLSGEVAVVVEFEPSRDPGSGFIRVEVRDTGIGIPPEVTSSLFRPFTQADSSTTRRFGGTGLGLAISKNIVTLMGGEIGVTSEVGRGSVFWFTVRLSQANRPDFPLPPSPVSGKMILIVDDNQTNRRVLELQLNRNGYATHLAENGAQALAILGRVPAARPFDAVLTDLHMPAMDGFELTAAIRARFPDRRLPVLLLTSHAAPGADRETAAKARISGFLLKPVRESQLLRALEKVFSAEKDASSADHQVIAERIPVTALPAGWKHLRILVAEDNPVNQKVTSLILRKLGYAADVVANGQEVLSALQIASYDLILMDCQMPEMDGFEATQAIRASLSPSARIPIIALTANALPGEKDRCICSGMNDYLSKPIKPEALAQKLEEWVPKGPVEAAV